MKATIFLFILFIQGNQIDLSRLEEEKQSERSTTSQNSITAIPTRNTSQLNEIQRLNQDNEKLRKELSEKEALVARQQDSINAQNDSLLYWAQDAEAWRLWNEDNKSAGRYQFALTFSIVISLIWLIGMIVLLFYSIRRYHFHGGLKHENYDNLVRTINEDDTIPLNDKELFYPQNPYKNETFGLPRGTIRMCLTLSLLVINVLVLYISFYAPPTSVFADRIDFVTTAFLMMIAFYFGSKAVDVYKAHEKSKTDIKLEEMSLEQKTMSVGVKPSRPTIPQRITPKPPPPPDERPTTSPKQDIERDDKEIPLVAKANSNRNTITEKALGLTTFFETGKELTKAYGIVAGNFDGMGISFGCLQWNLGQGTLQPVLLNYFKQNSPRGQGDPNLKSLYLMLQKPKTDQL